MTETEPTTAIQKIEPRVKTLQALLDKAKPAFEAALPKTLTVDKFMRVVLTSLRLNPKLAATTPASFISCVLQAAQLGLVPDGILGHAYLVPFHDNKTDTDICTLIPGYKGLVELALRSNMVSTVEAAVVYTKDRWEYERGLTPKLVHVPVEEDAPGEMRLSYAIATMKDGVKRAEVLFRRDVLRIKNVSQTGRKGYGPWKDWEEEMWKKTAIRRLCKLLPLSPEDRRMIDMDEMNDAGQPIDMSEVVDLPYGLSIAAAEAGGDLPKSRLDAAAETLASKRTDAVMRADPSYRPEEPDENGEIGATPETIPVDLVHQIHTLIDRVGEVRIAGWLWKKYGITKLEEVHKLKVGDQLDLHDDLQKGNVEVEIDPPATAKRKGKGDRPTALFDAAGPTPGTE